MNVIANLTGNAHVNAGIENALSYLKIDKLFIIEFPEKVGQPVNKKNNYVKNVELRKKCVQSYAFNNVYTGNYNGYIESDNLIAPDNELLSILSPHLIEAVKILERTSEYYLTFEERLEKIFSHIRYWNTIIERHNINLLVLESPGHESYDYILELLCHTKGIKTVSCYNCTVLGYSYTLESSTVHTPELNKLYERFYDNYKNTPMEDIHLDKPFNDEFEKQTGADINKSPYYMTDGSIVNHYDAFAKSKGKLKDLAIHFKYIKNIILGSAERYSRILDYQIFRDTKKYFDVWDSLLKPIDMKNEKYIYFPLHFQPEITTAPFGEFYVWQHLAVEVLNNCLPKDVFIYVKEHPQQGFRSRTIDFPEKLAKLSQVKLVHRDTNTYQLIENSIAVSTIVGTALWEGLFKGKPAIMFGNFITQHAPGVFKVKTNAECQNAVDQILSHNCAPTHKELKIFTRAMQEICFFGFTDIKPLLNSCSFEESSIGIEYLFLDGFKKYLSPENFKEG